MGVCGRQVQFLDRHHDLDWSIYHALQVHHLPCRRHAILAAAAPRNPGFQTVIFPGSLGYALYPSAQVP